MADTGEVLNRLNLAGTTTQLLVIVANARGAEDASRYPEVKILGYPFSISETFQRRNTNSGIQLSCLCLSYQAIPALRLADIQRP